MLTSQLDQVKSALDSIWRDNLQLRNSGCRRKQKRSSFDPAHLTWIPRKRHNTRWPINPPREGAEFIAQFQPLIKFELHPSQIDEAVSFEQESRIEENDAHKAGALHDSVLHSPRVPEPYEPTQQSKREKPGRRRRTLRPSLSTISEVTDEATIPPLLTPTSNRLVHVSLAKTWQGAAEKSKTPTKVAESPMKDFTLDATPNAGEVNITNQSGHSTIPSLPADADGSPGLAPIFNHADDFLTPSTLYTERTGTHGPVLKDVTHCPALAAKDPHSVQSVALSSDTYVTALPFFDQPIPDVQIEPEHESRRRISLDNARHSDRTSNFRIIKRAHNWMAGASVENKRRHSDIGTLHAQKVPKRRHTLDVDAGLNPDIFGQLKTLPTAIKTPQRSAETSYQPLAAVQEHVSIISATHLEEAQTQMKTMPPQDVDLALSENEDNVEGDSDMAYLQKFVQRSRSSKEEKRDDTASAPILLQGFSKKRRSGSMNSATSDAGSPMAKVAVTAVTNTNASLRVPLGEKDANKSPSPSKKRKLKGAEDGSAPIKKKNGRLVAPDLDDLEPATNKRKKRRKGIESNTDDIFNPEMDCDQILTQRATASGTGARRSTRIATHKTEPAPINVRVPGGVFVDNSDMPAVSTTGVTNAVLQRKVDQDLATKTRANTRKNRGGAVPVQIALAAMAERSGNGDHDEATTTTIVSVEPTVDRPGGVKTVRWDETLARVQGEETTVTATAAGEPQDETAEAELQLQPVPDREEGEDDTQLPSPPQLRVVGLPVPGPDRPGNPVADQLAGESNEQEEAVARKSAPIRRSSRAATASRLPKRGGGVVPAAAPPMTAPKRSSLPAPSRLSKSGGGVGGVAIAAGAAEARARLGMAGPGTPAPRRAGRRGGRRE